MNAFKHVHRTSPKSPTSIFYCILNKELLFSNPLMWGGLIFKKLKIHKMLRKKIIEEIIRTLLIFWTELAHSSFLIKNACSEGLS